ncbi:helix-turn-helix transcriptional regulator [Ralstonia pseudosolanacearum]|uniref:helix-turn-helix transcriptional regulator n=1 Tax=Ralstonia pseudosolanacearum TaxID=1310165 RepID=UPI0022B1BAE7|nr:helix-turn-helix transcriptional regulator [Ralstonia pseudosolanacearum]
MRRRRQAMKLSQEALGDMLGLDRNTISRIERGAPNLSLLNAAEIARALGTNLSEMLGKQAKPEPDTVQAFGSRVREQRTAKGWNQRELAERIGVDRNWVSAIESGRQNVSLLTLRKFADALSVDPTDLLS